MTLCDAVEYNANIFFDGRIVVSAEIACATIIDEQKLFVTMFAYPFLCRRWLRAKTINEQNFDALMMFTLNL